MPNELIQALLKSNENQPPGASPFGMEAPRPEDAIRDLYKSNPTNSSWLSGVRNFTQAMDPMRLVQPPGPQTGSVPQDLAGSIGLASLGLKPTVSYTNTPRPTLRSQGRIVSQNRPMPTHPATNLAPAIGAGQIAANTGIGELPTTADTQAGSERPIEMPGQGNPSFGTAHPSALGNPSFGDRFGSFALPSQPAAQDPAWLQAGQTTVPPTAGMNVPLPRPKPQQTAKKAKPKAKALQPEPGIGDSIANFLRSLGLG
jgi:hypothetical protein